MLAYLRMVYAPNDLDFLWTIKRPRKGFGKKSIEDLKKYAAEHEIGLFQALGEQIEQGTVKKKCLLLIIKIYRNYTKNMISIHAKSLLTGYWISDTARNWSRTWNSEGWIM